MITDPSQVLLPEKAKQEMNELLTQFKQRALKELEAGLENIYTDIGLHIETDAWINFRSELMQAMAYDNSWKDDQNAWARNVRLKILEEHKDELILLINKDLLSELDSAKGRIKDLQNSINRY